MQARPALRDFNTYQPSARATRIDAAQAPAIDGDLSDPVWANAQVIDEFYVVEPEEGQTPSQPTIARFLYDDNTLYVGITAYDSEPDKIVATVKARDGRLDVDDTVRVLIDPQLTRRDAYYFEMNALGARVDALIQNNSVYIGTWNTIWAGAAKRQSNGFSVEWAIPFRDLSFDPSSSDWGLEIQRGIRRTGERIRWSTISAPAYYADISRAGTLTGISGINQGLGLDVQVYGKFSFKHEWKDDESGTPERDSLKFVPSGNLYYKVTPGLTGTLTIDPDFSDSPLDIRQTNTTRFVLFQPETRGFFLQDAASFEFGGRGYVRSDAINRDNGRPFFSRNIGLANGAPVSITAGGKVSGEAGGVGIGALTVLTDGTGTTQNRQVLSVARITAPVLRESKLGLIFTNGDPSGLSRNTLGGADFQFLDSDIGGGKVLGADAYYLRSFSNTKGDDDSFGAALNYPNEPWGGDFHFKQIGPNYFPALGFTNRTGIRNYDFNFIRRDRNIAGFRFVEVLSRGSVFTSLDNHLESRENIFEARVGTQSTDEWRVRLIDDFEDVPEDFTIAGKVPVHAGRYSWTNIGAEVRTSDGRPYSAQVIVACCSFYNGNYFLIDFRGDYRPNELFEIQPQYVYTFIDLPTGSVGIHLATLDFVVNFTPDMQLFTQVQFDNISQNVALSVRYRWEYRPGDEIFVSLGQAAVIPGTTFRPQISQAIVRLGNTFRF